MKVNSVTIEKIQNILLQNKTTIETKVENEKLFLRNYNWETIKVNLTPIEQIQQKKKGPKVQNNNFVHLQNNYYYNFNPHMMYPQQIQQQWDSLAMQQMQMQQMGMLGANQFQNPYAFQNQQPGNNGEETPQQF